MERNAGSRLATAALWISLGVFAASLSLQDIRTYDYWWHLRTGALIAETGSIPKYDPYTYTVPGNRWVDVHWLHQLGLHGLYSLGGHAAVVVAKFAMVLVLVGILATIGYRRHRAVLSVLALALMLMVAGDRFMPRPELPTFLCLAAVLALLDRFTRKADAGVYAIAGVQLFWVNVHGLFAVGIALCAIYLAAEIIRPLVAPGEPFRPGYVRRLLAVTALATLVSLLNPNFLDGALYPVQQLGMIGPVEERGAFGMLVAELTPPLGFREPLNDLALGLFFTLTGFSFAAMVLNWRRIQVADPLLWVAFLYLALGAKRNLALFAIVSVPILTRNLNDVLDARAVGARPRASPRLRAAGAALVSLLLLGLTVDVVRNRFYERLGSMRTVGFGPIEMMYPVGAVDWIEREHPPGPIAHHMADGGYLIWRLYPDYEVMVDGRLEVYGAEKFIELQIAGPERFRRLDEQYGFGMVLVHYSMLPSDELLWWLYLNSNWQLVFVDEVAALFARVPAGGSPRYVGVDLDSPDLFSPLDGTRHLMDSKRRISRMSFYAAMKRHERALELWEETMELYPDLPGASVTHARLLHRNGFRAAAEAILRRLIAESPGDGTLHMHAGDLRIEANDLEGARELYEEALAIDPSLTYALYQLGRIYETEGETDAAVRAYMGVLARGHPAEGLSILARARLSDIADAP